MFRIVPGPPVDPSTSDRPGRLQFGKTKPYGPTPKERPRAEADAAVGSDERPARRIVALASHPPPPSFDHRGGEPGGVVADANYHPGLVGSDSRPRGAQREHDPAPGRCYMVPPLAMKDAFPIGGRRPRRLLALRRCPDQKNAVPHFPS